eukprot:855423_1
MNKPSSNNNESKDNDLCPARQQLRFTSINSINRKLTKRENVLKYAEEQIEIIIKNSNILDDAFKYEFDIFEFINYTHRPLLVLGIYLLKKSFIKCKLFRGHVWLTFVIDFCYVF